MGTPGTTTIFTARRIITLNGYRPYATAVAVRDGEILAAGTVEECRSWGDAEIHDRFADKVLMPGMVESHGHTAQGAMLALPHLGWYDAPMPDGSHIPGVRSYEEILERLRRADTALPEGEVLLAGGFDPIFYTGQERLSRRHLDQVSTTRPIFVRHASLHLATVNSATLTSSGITRSADTPGVVFGPDGEPTGELEESDAMALARSALQKLMTVSMAPSGIVDYGRLCRNAGVTTTSELLGPFIVLPQTLAEWTRLVDEDFPVRICVYNIPALPGRPGDYPAAARTALGFRDHGTDKLRMGGIKLIADGSLQGWTACCGSPGYYTGGDHAQPQFTDEDLTEAVRTFHEAGLQVFCHANGDATVGQFVDAVDAALRDHAWLDHRHTVQHSQLTTAAQYRRMARLGIAANIFTNHIWYWGDQHHDLVVGPERVERMWACRSAVEAGVSVSYHSDSGVTPVGQLHTAWCAVNRVTPSGRVLGTAEQVDVEAALRAVTIEAAYQLHLDDEIGTIEPGKRADFAVLEEDPLEVEPAALRDVPVWGTVLGGVVQQAERPSSDGAGAT